MYQNSKKKRAGEVQWIGNLGHLSSIISQWLFVPSSNSQIKAHQGLRFKLRKSCCIWPFLAKQRRPRKGCHLLTSVSTELAHRTLFRAVSLSFPEEEPVYFHQYLSLSVEDIKSWPHRWQTGAQGLLGYSYVDVSWLSEIPSFIPHIRQTVEVISLL